MKQQNISKQCKQHERSRTRNQRKRELRRLICMAAAVGMLMASVMCMMVKAFFEHPAEQPISYSEHMETVLIIGGDSYGNLQD